MRTVTDATRNQQLQQSRERRGWSRAQLAEHLGTNAFTVYRWERGLATPSPYYRQQLAAIFVCSLEELGLLPSTAMPSGAAMVPVGESQTAATAISSASLLPLPPTVLIGRADEVAAIEVMLRSQNARLVTLTGVGGVGKTRVALAVAREMDDVFVDGVSFVPLASLREPALVASTIAQALGLSETDELAPEERLCDWLRGKHLLLVLDNAEHLLSAMATLVEQIVSQCAGPTLLVTSRAPLGLRGEQQVTIGPLALPPAGPSVHMDGIGAHAGWLLSSYKQETDQVDAGKVPEALAEVASVALFLNRVRELHPSFTCTAANATTVAAICRRLEGLPLAIELAAAGTKVFPLPILLDRLDYRLLTLTRGARDLPARQRSLRQTLAWSYELLSAPAQQVFRRLAIFVGSWTLDALAYVCGGTENSKCTPVQDQLLDALFELVDHSLVFRVNGEEQSSGEQAPEPEGDMMRFALLESVREFAWELLQSSDDVDVTARRHALHCCQVVEVAKPHLVGADQMAWNAHLAHEYPNLRVALQWANEQKEAALGLRLVGALWKYWYRQGDLSEGRYWLEAILTLAGVNNHGSGEEALVERLATWGHPAAQALNGLGSLAERQGEYELARRAFGRSLALRQRLSDIPGVPAVMGNLAGLAQHRGEFDQARALHEASLALLREMDQPQTTASELNNLGELDCAQGQYSEAIARYEESLALRRELGDIWGIALVLGNLGNAARLQGDDIRARIWLDESLALRRELGDVWGQGEALLCLARLTKKQGDDEAAIALYRESLAHYYAAGDRIVAVANCIEGLAEIAGAQGAGERAAHLCSFAQALRGKRPIHVIIPYDRMAGEQLKARLQVALGDEVFAAAWKAGMAMSLEQALNLAWM